MKHSARCGWLVLLAAVACEGRGSDVGPSLARLPDASSKVLVLDDQGRGVVGATVELVGLGLRTITGPNGRGDFHADPRGNTRIRIAAGSAAADDGDELGSLTIATSLTGGDLPGPFFLPAVDGASSITLAVGTLSGGWLGSNSDPLATGTVRVSWSAGTNFNLTEGGSAAELRTTTLRSAHLPPTLVEATGAGILCSQGIWVDPPTATFAPGATLDVHDEFGLGSGLATLWHLDVVSGAWSVVASGLPLVAGNLSALGAVQEGGLYVFTAAVATGAVSGRVVDVATPPVPLAGMLVNVDGRHTRTAADGTFTVADVPAALVDGTPRTVDVEVFAGGSHLPAGAATTATMNGTATIAVGDVALDTLPAGLLRIQALLRGRASARTHVAVSTLYGGVAVAGSTDDQGQIAFDDVPAGWFGFQEGYERSRDEIYYAQAIGYMEPGRRRVEAALYFGERDWFVGSRRTRVYISDADGGGPLLGAVLVRGTTAGAGYVGTTREAGLLFADRDMERRATATFRSARGGQTLTAAFTVEQPNAEHLELPLPQLHRGRLGAFDRHGLVRGSLIGSVSSRTKNVVGQRRLSLQEWWEAVADGREILAALPVHETPAPTATDFLVGVPPAGGHVVATEGVLGGALLSTGFAFDVTPTEGQTTTQDITLRQDVTNFFGLGALDGLSSQISSGQLVCDLALRRPDGSVVDVRRAANGNHLAVGNGLGFTLTPLTGELAEHQWLVHVRGSATNNGVTTAQRALWKFGGSDPTTSAPFLEPPTLLAPAPGSTVTAAGFTVSFALPAGCLFGTLELHSTSGGDTLRWQAVVPPEQTEFTFPALPTEATTPLVAGRTYSLTVRGHRALAGPHAGVINNYPRVTAYLQSMGAIEQGIDAVSAVTVQVTLQ